MISTTPISCVIIDDDEIDRLTTLAFVKQYPVLHIAGVYASPEAYLAQMQTLPQVLFLDVDMPGINGLDLRKQLMDVPVCIFVTAYPDYAVDGFALAALDYLVKPIQAQRFATTIQRIYAWMELRQKAHLLSHTLGGDNIIIKEGTTQVKIPLHEVLYLEALKDYTRIITHQQSHYVLSSLGELLRQQAFQTFIRIHKSYAVPQFRIEKWNNTQVVLAGITLPVGRAYKAALGNLH